MVRPGSTAPPPRGQAGTTEAERSGQGSVAGPLTAGARTDAPPPHRRARQVAAVYAVSQALALAAWWHLLAAGPASSLPAGSADPAQEAWFLAWLPHALGSGGNPFVSHAVFAPDGVNLLANTSTDLLGLLLAPITVSAGPIAALGVAAILGPALSATSAFVLCRRFVRWQPAAFLGALCYGFGPFAATDLRYGHVDLTWLAVPPLVFACLHELTVRRRRPPLVVGAALGALVVAQFFLSTELLAVTALMVVAAAVIAALARPRSLRPALAHAWPGLAVAVAVPVTVLAYPVWVAVAGPRHPVGPVWPHIGDIATTLASTVQPHGELAGVAFISGGNGGYLGVTMLVVLVAGAVSVRWSAALRMALALMVVAFVASLGYRLHAGKSALGVPMPAAVLGHLPVLDSIVPERFAAMTDLFAGVALAVVADGVRAAVAASGARFRRLGSLAAVGVSLVALAPLAVLPRWPYPVRPIHQPALLASLAGGAGGAGRSGVGGREPVFVVYPDAPSAVADEMVWQAEDAYAFRLPNGYAIVPGPGGRAAESPRTNALWLVLAAASVHRLQVPLTATTRGALRQDLRAVHATVLVLLPRAPDGATLRRALTEALGTPQARSGGWVWRLPR